MREALLTRALLTKAKQNGYFFLGLSVGLWIALVVVPMEDPPVTPCASSLQPSPAGEVDEYEPAHTVRPASAAGPSRSLTRPRYYTTELGVRAPLLAAVLTTEDALKTMGAALNVTLRALQPALRLFSAAAGRTAVPRPNVVGFTDARVTLTPFHALKYLADNHLDDYHFFFLVSDTTYINAKRLQELVSRLSVSRDVYMGVPAGDGQYCALEGGVLLSRSVLQAVHGELEWCVRNAYSVRHHENMGRCVLHAAKVGCMSEAQSERYLALSVPAADALLPEYADAVAVHPVTDPQRLHQIHAYTTRVHLQRLREEERGVLATLPPLRRRHPPGYRNATWPAGLRADTGLSPPPPASRWDHIRWTPFNETHALMPDDRTAVRALHAAHKRAIDTVLEAAFGWAASRWGGREMSLVEGAMQWEPSTALRYRLLLGGVWTHGDTEHRSMRQLEVSRPLGAARLVAVPYVTESARVRLVLPVLAVHAHAAAERGRAFVRRYVGNKQRNDNTALTVVVLSVTSHDCSDACDTAIADIRNELVSHGHQYLTAPIDTTTGAVVSRTALVQAARKAATHSLLLLLDADLDYNDDMLNRVRMNTIAGYQWYLPVPFARYALYNHPLFVDANGNKPAQRTGHFNGNVHTLAVYSTDVATAVAKCGDDTSLSAAQLVHCSGLRVLRGPEPGLLRAVQGPPCVCTDTTDAAAAMLYVSCLSSAARDMRALQLGAANDLAKLLLQTNA